MAVSPRRCVIRRLGKSHAEIDGGPLRLLESAWAPTPAARRGRRRGRCGARAGSRSTQVRLRSMMIRLGVIAGNRTCAARSRATPSGSNQPVARSDSGLRSWSTQRRAVRAEEGLGPAGAEHRLGPVGDPRRERPRGDLAEQPLVGPPAQLVLRRDRGAEGDHVVVEQRIPRLDRRVHGHAVALRHGARGPASITL